MSDCLSYVALAFTIFRQFKIFHLVFMGNGSNLLQYSLFSVIKTNELILVPI